MPLFNRKKKEETKPPEETKKIVSEATFLDTEKIGKEVNETLTETLPKSKDEKKEDKIEILNEAKAENFEEKSKEERKKEIATLFPKDEKKQLNETKVQPENPNQLSLEVSKDGIMRVSDKGINQNQNTQQLILRDASSVIAEKLPAQLGSSPNVIETGEWDDRKLSDITDLDKIWLAYFDLLDPMEGGEWAKKFAYGYAAWSDSVGGKRAKLLVQMQMAAGGGGGNMLKTPEDRRNFIERHFTKRGQEPKGDNLNEL